MNIRAYQLLVVIFIIISCNTTSQKEKHQSRSELEVYVNHIIDHYEMIGGAIAVSKDNEIIYSKYFGVENIETNKPVTENTLFRLHSLSKIFVATYIFKQIEQGNISLDDEIGNYLTDLSSDWKTIKISNLLTHSSGLPDIRNFDGLSEEDVRDRVFAEEIRFKPNHHFQYNQINYWLMNKLVEKISGKDFELAVLGDQFQNYESTVKFLENNLSENNNYAKGYKLTSDREIKVDSFTVPKYVFGSAGLNITLNEFVKWNHKLENNIILKEKTKKAMWKPNKYYSQTNDYAFGWDIRMLNNQKSLGFNGGGKVAYRVFPDNNIAIIILTNGAKYESILETNINRIAGIVDSTLINEREYAFETMWESFIKDTQEIISNTYDQLIRSHSTVNLEDMVIGMGYDLLYGYEQSTLARKVFELNVEKNPNSWIAFSHLGGFYEYMSEYDQAVSTYQKSIQLNRENQDNWNNELETRIRKIKKNN